MSQTNSNTKDDFQVVLLLSCFVGHPVSPGILTREKGRPHFGDFSDCALRIRYVKLD